VSVQLAVSFSNNAMTWATPQHTRTQVDNAGRILIADEGPPDDPNDPSFDEAWERYENALTIINNWRSSHSFPLNTSGGASAKGAANNCYAARGTTNQASVLDRSQASPL
jgi:hypothetical protein